MRHLILILAVAAVAAEESSLTFSQIRPILETSCAECHGAKKAKHDLRLTSIEGVMKGGKEMGSAVVPGNPDESPLVKVLTLPRTNKMAMPPDGHGDPLSEEQIARIKKWIADGARP